MESAPILPPPNEYEDEYKFWPWGDLIAAAINWMKAELQLNANVCDYMCGTGFLIAQLARERPDLNLSGCTIDLDYIDYGKKKYPGIKIEAADALVWRPPVPPSAVICTGGLHHLDREHQPAFVAKVARELLPGAYFLIGEELIREYATETERRMAVLDLSTQLIRHLIDKSAPHAIIQAAVDVLGNDLGERGEYKLSYGALMKLLAPYFVVESSRHFWPVDVDGIGDVLLVCRRR